MKNLRKGMTSQVKKEKPLKDWKKTVNIKYDKDFGPNGLMYSTIMVHVKNKKGEKSHVNIGKKVTRQHASSRQTLLSFVDRFVQKHKGLRPYLIEVTKSNYSGEAV